MTHARSRELWRAQVEDYESSGLTMRVGANFGPALKFSRMAFANRSRGL